MLETGFAIASSVVSMLSSPLVTRALGKLAVFLQTQEQDLKQRLGVPEVIVDEVEFLGVCNALVNYDPNQKGNVNVGAYNLDGIFAKLNPESINNRFTLDDKNQKSYSLASFIIEQTRIYISNERNSNQKRNYFILAMNKLIDVLNSKENLFIQLTVEDKANLEEIKKLRGTQTPLAEIKNKKEFVPIELSLLSEKVKVLNRVRVDKISKSFDGKMFDHPEFPFIYANIDLIGYDGTPLDQYINLMHSDTINNLFGGRSLLTKLLTCLDTFIDGKKEPQQDKNAFKVFSFLIQAVIDKGANISDADNILCSSINTKLAQYKESEPLVLKLEKSKIHIIQVNINYDHDGQQHSSASTASTSHTNGATAAQQADQDRVMAIAGVPYGDPQTKAAATAAVGSSSDTNLAAKVDLVTSQLRAMAEPQQHQPAPATNYAAVVAAKPKGQGQGQKR